MKIPKSNQYKRVYNVLWVFYAFFVVIIAAIAYISIDEMNKMSVISENYKTMNKVYFISDDILDSTSDYHLVQENLESLKLEVGKLDLLYLEENQKLKTSVHTKLGELEFELKDTNNPNITKNISGIMQSIKWDSRDFIQNILLKDQIALNETQKLVLVLIIIAIIVLTIVLIMVILPAIRKLDKYAIKLATISKEREESLQNLKARNKEIYFREKRFATIAELSPIGLFLTDAKGKCEFVNQRYVDIVGASYEDCTNDMWKYGIYEGDRDRMLESWTKSVRNNEDYFLDEYRIEKNGELRDIAVKAKPIRGENNEITGFVGMIEDITDAKIRQSDLQSTANKFEAFVDDLPYGAVLISDNGLYFNKAVEEIIGYNNDEIKNIDDWFQILYRSDADSAINIYNENKGQNFAAEVIQDIITKSGEVRKIAFKDKMTSVGEIWGLEDRTDFIRVKAEKKAINEKYKFILDSLKVGVWNWTIEDNSLDWNEQMYQLYGYGKDKKVHNYDDYKNRLFQEDKERVSREIIHVLKTPGDEFDTTFRIALESNEIRYMRAISKTYRDQDGRAIQMVGVNWDITVEKRSEEVRKELAEKYDLILNTTEIGVWDWDLKTDNLYWNDTMYKLFEVSKESEDKFKDYQAKLHEGDSERMQSNLEKILSGEWEEFESESRLVLSDGSTRYLKAITKIVKDDTGNVGRIYGINLDISELKKSELELIESKDKAETANRAKSTFLANMSHEIRTPMNAILGFGEILQNNNKDERNQDYITGIIKSGNSLLSLINDILDFSKIEANKMTLNLNSVDLKRIISDIDKIFEFTAGKKGIQYYSNIDMNLPPYLIMDEGKIKQVLINLLGNAVKFTESGSISLDVNFEFHEKDTSKLRLSFTIKDSGIGISQDKLNSIFNAFEQEDDNDSRKYEGTGLGLSIVKSIVELQSGTIRVESELGKGSTFIVTIPDVSISLMRPNLLSHSTKSDFEKYDLSDKTVLFAEDIESNRNVVQGFLKDYAITVLFAHNGAEALAIARANKTDLAFIDLHMPLMDGMTMAEIWTNDEDLKSIPLIALTAEVYNKEKYLDKDYFKHYLTKPVRAEEIYDVILLETGMKEALEISDYEQIDEVLLTSEAQNILINHNLVEPATKLLTKLNTRELGKLIEKIEFIAEMENNYSLREYTRELKLALDTFNVYKIKHLLSLSNNNI